MRRRVEGEVIYAPNQTVYPERSKKHKREMAKRIANKDNPRWAANLGAKRWYAEGVRLSGHITEFVTPDTCDGGPNGFLSMSNDGNLD